MPSMPRRRRSTALGSVICAIALVAGSVPAMAHDFGAEGGGFLLGLAHPLVGLDHLLAMIAVGLWAAQIGRPALWLVPIAFPLGMAVGALAAVSGLELPAVEAGTAASVLTLGLLIALAVRVPIAGSLAVVAAFALFHGHAHGSELPAAASPILYGIGFILATGALHLVGLGIGTTLRRPAERILVRCGGAAVAAGGLLLLLAS